MPSRRELVRQLHERMSGHMAMVTGIIGHFWKAGHLHRMIIDFCRIEGRHTGRNLANQIRSTIDEEEPGSSQGTEISLTEEDCDFEDLRGDPDSGSEAEEDIDESGDQAWSDRR
ncbi:hypothetical protein Pmar_PMAR028880 [Perkinsus marinus ATCC 50983]|uniref:Uncharacterized protein n=1 Tax=Perkinsus marinus (strain ATCC 50983 / TXsc) TaxID=423536 RepID=C5L8F7_PERM5|nr:hypothetical protein Pmar_PMAR028880 [Perkinsus marinus ATCC 50983]EER06977.1 hypothetical protein Pmar_PMAR028880 [Perkinsus marinus ATCC 50983]|eukprot:XP_002775161.1 hypothetical protein Pmar_PMAR028880 [Perkinsus marinus ATCC 50983]